MSKLQGATAQQSVALWDRNKNDRGHMSSVDKAVAAHRQRVSEREGRTEHRLAVARDINSRFFPKPELQQVSQKSHSIAPVEMENYEAYEENYLDSPMQPGHNQVQEIYEEINLAPSRDLAVSVLNKDVDDVSRMQVDEDVPKGSYIDREA